MQVGTSSDLGYLAPPRGTSNPPGEPASGSSAVGAGPEGDGAIGRADDLGCLDRSRESGLALAAWHLLQDWPPKVHLVLPVLDFPKRPASSAPSRGPTTGALDGRRRYSWGRRRIAGNCRQITGAVPRDRLDSGLAYPAHVGLFPSGAIRPEQSPAVRSRR